MKHTWLNPDEQAKMTTACDTASEYGYIGLFSVGKAWKRHVEGMVGSKVEPANYLRAHCCSGQVMFGDWLARKEVRAIIRLTKEQAMLMKLRHGGSDEAWVRPDPEGDIWGWLTVFHKCDDYRLKAVARGLISRLLTSSEHPYQVEKLERYANRLPDGWQRSFLFYQSYNPALADNPIPGRPPEESVADLSDTDIWHAPADTFGAMYARQFWERANGSAHFRDWNGLKF